MTIRDYMKDHFLFLDGGMGTLLQNAGLRPGELPERWNVSHPEEIIRIQTEYYNAGSNVVLANTFGASCLKFEEEELRAVVRAALDNAKRAREASAGQQEKFVALDIGPLGRLLKPYGDFEFEEAVEAYAKTVRIGAEAGADLVFIETMNDSYDTKAALLAVKENCSLPVFVSNAYGSDGKLMTGASPAAMVALLEGMHADAIGANCSLGPEQLVGVIEEYLTYASVPVLIKPNAGLPRSENGKTVYDVFPPAFGDAIRELFKKGVRIAGGCCGTTPEYIRSVVEASEGLSPVPVREKEFSLISSYTNAVSFGTSPILIGERINPTGKKRFQQALREGDMDYILNEGLKQADAHVQVLDVNVGLPEIDETAMLTAAVQEIQAVTDLPLQLDTSSPEAMEAALRVYNGKAMVNSVNGKDEVMEAVFPLVAKYGGLVVALTLDEGGIPEKAGERVAIAEKIIRKAAEYGIAKKDLIFDPLAMTISADTKAALSTLRAVHDIRHVLGANTSLGVSNVSFGLPARNVINSAFFAMALEQGLSAAIMNPFSQEMMQVYYAFRALHDLDENCADYIAYAASLPAPAPSGGKAAGAGSAAGGGSPAGDREAKDAASGSRGNASTPSTEGGPSPLQNAIIRGLKEQAGRLTGELLNILPPLSIVQKEVIPALDTAGIRFEQKTVYLPQLLMAAEAAKEAFEKIKEAMAKTEDDKGPKRCAVIIATVHGDIHDIGKNIVKLILENYGFDVTDLGKDVPPAVIVDKAIELHAPLVGLSALMTTTVPAMEETIKLLREKAPWVRTAVGGAVLTKAYADRIGADRYCRDAMETVRYAEEVERTLL